MSTSTGAEPVALHDQVAAEIRRAIAEGEAGPGERLPLAKDIAAVLGVNKNTVLRAMHILRDEGLLEFTRGRGITVSGTAQKGAVLNQVHELIEFAAPSRVPTRGSHRHDRRVAVSGPTTSTVRVVGHSSTSLWWPNREAGPAGRTCNGRPP